MCAWDARLSIRPNQSLFTPPPPPVLNYTLRCVYFARQNAIVKSVVLKTSGLIKSWPSDLIVHAWYKNDISFTFRSFLPTAREGNVFMGVCSQGVYDVTSYLFPCSFWECIMSLLVWSQVPSGGVLSRGMGLCSGGVSIQRDDPHYWHLVAATAAVGTHPTGKLSCLAARLSYCLHNRGISNLSVLMAAPLDLLAVLFQVWLMAESASTWGGSES